jgi:hypothetical protein
MQVRWRSVVLGAAMTAVAGTAGCGAADGSGPAAGDVTAPAGEAAATSSSPGVYGVEVDPSRPDPTDVATDAPVTVEPNDDGSLPVSLTFADWNATTAAVEVDGYLAGIVEDGGTCTLTLTQGGATATAEVPGTADATTTSCGGASVPGAQLAPGTWTAVLTYRSGTSTGTSAPAEVTVP